MIDSTTIGILLSLIGIIIAFSIGQMSSAYRFLLQVGLKDKKRIKNLKIWVEIIENYLNTEILWLLSGLSVIVIIIISYVTKFWERLYNELIYYIMVGVLGFGWILIYVIDTYCIQKEELNKLKNISK